MSKNIVAGLGEIGMPILNSFPKSSITIGYDINQKLMDDKIFQKYSSLPTKFLHVCIPFNSKFIKNVQNISQKFSPQIIVIHSTIEPGTTKKLQKNLTIPVIYSATRGIHKRMDRDLKRYTKFFGIENGAPKQKWAIDQFTKLMKDIKVNSKKMSSPIALELAKIVVDTSYYGWLINYAQISNLIAKKHKVDYDEMWSFADEIQKYLGNRPKMFPGFIGGHCVIPNLSLINEESLWEIEKINNIYSQKIKNSKSIAKKYVKGKQSYTSNI